MYIFMLYKYEYIDVIKLLNKERKWFQVYFSNALFDRIVYGLIDGAVIAPVLVNLFLGHHENIRLNFSQSPSIQFY